MKSRKTIMMILLICNLFFNNKNIQAQSDTIKNQTVGIEITQFAYYYSIFYKLDFDKYFYMFKLGYTPDGFGLNHGNGTLIQLDYNKKLNNKKNYVFYSTGLFYNYIINKSVLINDEMYRLQYGTKIKSIGITEMIGYQWNYSNWNVSILGGCEYFYLRENISDIKYLYISNDITPKSTLDYTISKFKLLPALSLNFGFRF